MGPSRDEPSGGVVRGAGQWGVGRGLEAIVTAIAVCVACSSPSAHPPLLENYCPTTDASSCTVTSAGGGGGPGGDASTSGGITCDGMDFSGSSQCSQCAAEHCCSQFSTCHGSGSTSCWNLLKCQEAFEPDCTTMFAGGLATYNSLEDCLSGLCTVCGESGIGDPCAGSTTGCFPGLTCVDGWCTEACSASSDCAGLGPGGTNGLAEANACVTIAGKGDYCAPGCGANAGDCANFSGTFCFSTTSVANVSVSVCELPPGDAGH
jgi:hypothetical protein